MPGSHGGLGVWRIGSGGGLKSHDPWPFDTSPFDPFGGPVDYRLVFFCNKMTFLPLPFFFKLQQPIFSISFRKITILPLFVKLT